MDNSNIFESLAAIVFLAICVFLILREFISDESPEKRAGRIGEERVTEMIRDILTDDDILMTNIVVSTEDKVAELDNLIINSHGIFIIEVKNYNGNLYGSEDDYEWTKVKVTNAGNYYGRQVKNPIKQVKRQVYVLSKFLKQQELNYWIDGYVYLVRNNSPVISSYILHDGEEIDYVIHEISDNVIDDAAKEKLIKALS